MIIEFEIKGARVIVSGENLSVSITGDDGAVKPVSRLSAAGVASPNGSLRNYLEVSQTTQAEFAEQIGAHVITVNKWVNGNRRPSWNMVARIEQATGGVVNAAAWASVPDNIDPDAMTVAQKIKAVREELRMTQAELAAAVGCTQGEVSKWERGDNEPIASSFDAVMKLLEA